MGARWGLLLTAGGALAATPPAAAAAECYDAAVVARIVAQRYTEVPATAAARWPWFLDLEVRRTTHGLAPRGPLTVMALQSAETAAEGPVEVWLRRTADGRFNVVGVGEAPAGGACPDGTPPARPFAAGPESFE